MLCHVVYVCVCVCLCVDDSVHSIIQYIHGILTDVCGYHVI
jgi:hypothetical protein